MWAASIIAQSIFHHFFSAVIEFHESNLRSLFEASFSASHVRKKFPRIVRRVGPIENFETRVDVIRCELRYISLVAKPHGANERPAECEVTGLFVLNVLLDLNF